MFLGCLVYLEIKYGIVDGKLKICDIILRIILFLGDVFVLSCYVWSFNFFMGVILFFMGVGFYFWKISL